MSVTSVNSDTMQDEQPTFFMTGRVKWFDRKKGYGFITISEGTQSGEDVFVHHQHIQVENEQYKYLVQGEYVTFSLADAENDHKYQAVVVRGVSRGSLMCETYKTNQTTRPQKQPFVKRQRHQTKQHVHHSTQQTATTIDGEEWILMKRVTKPSQNTRGRGGRGRRGRRGGRGRGGHHTTRPTHMD